MDAASVSMLEILAYVEAELARGAQTIELDVLDPDVAAGHYAGERIGEHVHRPFRVWVDLADRLQLRLRALRPLAPPLVRMTYERLVLDAAPIVEGSDNHAAAPPDTHDHDTEKYGTRSEFARVHKLEEPTFVVDLTEALERAVAHVDSTEPFRVLDLGVNAGDELALMLARVPALHDAQIVGVDHSVSAIARARERFASHPNIQLIEGDVANRASLVHAVGRFDLVVSIGLLQSGALDDRELLRRIVQDHLTPSGAVILGMPNCRYVDGELEYGARIVNISQPELGLLVKDLAFYRKYLQQHHKRVFVTGKHYVFVTAVPA